MIEEFDALHEIGTLDLVDLPSGKSAIGCKWVYKIKTRSDVIATRLTLLPRVSLRSMGLIIRRLLLMWLDFLLSGLLLSFMPLANGHSFKWMSKILFLMVNSQRKSIRSFHLVTLTLRGSLTEYFDYDEHFMGLNKLLEHGLPSSLLLSLSMVFQAVLLIQLFF